jgi:hypothetical protein
MFLGEKAKATKPLAESHKNNMFLRFETFLYNEIPEIVSYPGGAPQPYWINPLTNLFLQACYSFLFLESLKQQFNNNNKVFGFFEDSFFWEIVSFR